MIIFIDTEFSDFVNPELLSLGMVSLDGREHYVELDLTCDIGIGRVQASSDFVRYGGILDLWGRIPGATATPWEMGRRSGEWLLSIAQGKRVDVAFDYPTDYELMEAAVRDANLWEQVRLLIRPVNVDLLVGRITGELASEACFEAMQPRGLGRHHALADAIALRAAYVAVSAEITGQAP